MKRIFEIFSVVVFFLAAAQLIPDLASAHRVNVFAWVDGDTVYVESKFPSGKKVKAGKVLVSDPRGNELLTGLTDDQGQFSFKVSKRMDLNILLIAGQGHQARWTVRADEMAHLALEKSTAPEKKSPPEPSRMVSKPSVGIVDGVSDPGINSRELEAVIESVLDKKLQPIRRMLADMQQEGPGVKDIFAGIGYILGLVGIGAYVHSRKKKG